MESGDMIAIGILGFCILLVMIGVFKWLARLIAGVIFGVTVLACIALLNSNPQFDSMTQGIFKRGGVIPSISDRIETLRNLPATVDEDAPEENGLSEEFMKNLQY